MSSDRINRPNGPNQIDPRIVARSVLSKILEPLIGVALDSDLGVTEFTAIIRAAVVRGIAVRQQTVAGRINISGISASTGIPRAAISRILGSGEQRPENGQDRGRTPIARILSAWNSDPRFGSPNGSPAHLRIYGRGSSFDALAKAHGRGIPTRALLDELAQVGAIEIFPSQVVKLKTTTLKQQRIKMLSIKAFGETATALLDSMLHTLRKTDTSVHLPHGKKANLSMEKGMETLLRRVVLAGGPNALNDLESKLFRTLRQHRVARFLSKTDRLELLILLREYRRKSQSKHRFLPRRRNLKRNGK